MRAAFLVHSARNGALDALANPGGLERLSELPAKPLAEAPQFAQAKALQSASTQPESLPVTVRELLLDQPLSRRSASGSRTSRQGESAQSNTARAGDQITQRNLDIQPTITIPPRAPVRLLVTRDLILAPVLK